MQTQSTHPLSYLAASLAMALAATGCSIPRQPSPTLAPDAPAAAEVGYLYGRFAVNTGPDKLNMTFTCANAQTITVVLEYDKPAQVKAYPVKPGDCSLTHTQFVGGRGTKETEYQGQRMKRIAIRAGEAVYVGEVMGAISMITGQTSPTTSIEGNRWEFLFSDDYEATTAEFRRRYPRLAALPVRSVSVRSR